MTDYASIRDALPIIGKRVVEVTCDDWEEVCAKFPDPEDRHSRVYVHLDDGSTLAFSCTADDGFAYDGYPDVS